MDELELMQQLIKQLNEWTFFYDKGSPKVSDKHWDDVYFELKKLEEETGIVLDNSPTQEIIYDSKVSELKKVKHNHDMLSLEKTKNIEEVNSFINNKDCLIMSKMDGLSCSLLYQNGILISAETRGNGEIGEDITHNAFVIKSIPKKISYREELVVDGEIICTYKDFEQFSNEYKNPRNFASGSIRLLDSQECKKRHLTFVAWSVIKGFKSNSLNTNLLALKELGFKIVPSIVSHEFSEKDIDFIKEKSKDNSYPIDGIVIRYDDIKYGTSLGQTSHHPNNAIAFKFYDEEAETILRDIEWGMGRKGVLTPVAIFDSIELEGTQVSRSNLHNISVMESLYQKPWHKGLKLSIIKSNQIIPYITKVEDSNYSGGALKIPKVCPVCGGETRIITSESGTKQLECTNAACQGKLINILDHYCSKKGLDIKGLSKATLEKLIDWGWLSSLEDIYNLKNYRLEWIKKSGFGAKSVDNILKAIEDNKNCYLENFISALGIPLIGVSVAKEIVKNCSNWEEFINKVENHYSWSKINGFGYEMEKAINNYDYTIAKKISKYLIFKEKQEMAVEEKDNKLKGLTFVITGKLKSFRNRSEVKDYIVSYGGKTSDSVNSKTNYLVNNDINSSSSKNKKAKELGIKIISEEQLKNFDF